MIRYWFKFNFEGARIPIGLRLGCGITAVNYDDALQVLKKCIFFDSSIPKIDECLVDIKVSDLDQSHVAPNMGNIAIRGVWFPQGYEKSIM